MKKIPPIVNPTWLRLKPWRRILKECFVGSRIRHLSGPSPLLIPPDEPVVCCVLRDGADYLPHFIRHHRKIGFRHFILLFNRCLDSSVLIAGSYERVTLLGCDLPFRHFEWEMRRVLVKRYCRRRWTLVLDIDETFDYPYSEGKPLSSLLGYLEGHRFNAVIGQMLDMHSDQPIDRIDRKPDLDLSSLYPYYDLAEIEKTGYREFSIFGCRNLISNPDIAFHRGGLRKTLFGLDYLWLTKHPLIFPDGSLEPITHSHFSNSARLADFSALIRHYPFLPSFKQKANAAIYGRRYHRNLMAEYRRYAEVLNNQPDLSCHQPSSQRLNHTSELLDERFLVASPQFLNWAGTEQV